MRTILGDARDEERWLPLRRQYLSASDLICFLTNGELELFGWERKKWMRSPDEIIEGKRSNEQRSFGKNPVEEAEAMARMWHGRENEDHNRVKILGAMGLKSRACHLMIGNDRWPYLSATLDGVVHAPTKERTRDFEGTTRPDLALEALAEMEFAPTEVGLVEMKQTNMFGAYAWLGKLKSGAPAQIPGYYQCQMQAQMALSEVPWGLGAAQCGTGDWVAHFLDLDEAFGDILDRINDAVSDDMKSIRKALAKEAKK